MPRTPVPRVDFAAADAGFLAQIDVLSSQPFYGRGVQSLPLDTWKPRFKKLGKTLHTSEWISMKNDWATELGLQPKPFKLPLWHLAFLELLLDEHAAQLWPQLRKRANFDFKIHFEAEPRRVSSRFHSLDLPQPGETTWKLTVQEGGSPYGPVVVFNLRAWEIVDSVLVD